jgi:hypothetical protein
MSLSIIPLVIADKVYHVEFLLASVDFVAAYFCGRRKAG